LNDDSGAGQWIPLPADDSRIRRDADKPKAAQASDGHKPAAGVVFNPMCGRVGSMQ
jgi:hypothetical protein